MDTPNIIYITENERKNKRKSNTNISIPPDGICVFEDCKYVCDSRKSQTYSMHILNNHSDKFKNEPIYKYKCSTCNYIFDKRADLMRHIKGVHQKETFHCYECNSYFKTKASLITHYMRKHTRFTSESLCVDNDNKCLNCYKTLNKSGFMYHMAICMGIDKTILVNSKTMPLERSINCQGCIQKQPNQLAHIDIGGCLYDSDN
jgi:predicted nucleic acid-binding Zn ribbon protein|tara:strand:- start:6532 stop:7140 length:609 start_codon:yes stop_codon:yes gene_type:complete